MAYPLIELLYVATVHSHVLPPEVGALNQAVALLGVLHELVDLHPNHDKAARDRQNRPASVTAPPASAVRIDFMRNLPSRTRPLTAVHLPGWSLTSRQLRKQRDSTGYAPIRFFLTSN